MRMTNGPSSFLHLVEKMSDHNKQNIEHGNVNAAGSTESIVTARGLHTGTLEQHLT